VLAAVEEWGVQLAAAMTAGIDPAAPFPRRFEQYWAAVLGRAPSASDLARGLRVVAADMSPG